MSRENTQFSSTNQPIRRRGQGTLSLITTKIQQRLEEGTRISEMQAYLKDPNQFPDQPTVKVWTKISNLDDLIDAAIEEARAGNIRALEWLSERAYGKVPDRIAHTDTDGNDLFSYFKINTSLLTAEEHALLLEFEHRTQKSIDETSNH